MGKGSGRVGEARGVGALLNKKAWVVGIENQRSSGRT